MSVKIIAKVTEVVLENLLKAFELMDIGVETPGEVTLESGPLKVDIHIPASVLTEIGFQQGRNEKYGLGINGTEDGVDLIFDRFYAPQQAELVENFLPGLNSLGKGASEIEAMINNGSVINVFFEEEDRVLHVAIVPKNNGAATENMFSDNKDGGVWH